MKFCQLRGKSIYRRKTSFWEITKKKKKIPRTFTFQFIKLFIIISVINRFIYFIKFFLYTGCFPLGWEIFFFLQLKCFSRRKSLRKKIRGGRFWKMFVGISFKVYWNIVLKVLEKSNPEEQGDELLTLEPQLVSPQATGAECLIGQSFANENLAIIFIV